MRRRKAIEGSPLFYFPLALHDELTLFASVATLQEALQLRGYPPAPGAVLHIKPQEIVEHRLSERQREKVAGARLPCEGGRRKVSQRPSNSPVRPGLYRATRLAPSVPGGYPPSLHFVVAAWPNS